MILRWACGKYHSLSLVIIMLAISSPGNTQYGCFLLLLEIETSAHVKSTQRSDLINAPSMAEQSYRDHGTLLAYRDTIPVIATRTNQQGKLFSWRFSF